MKLNLEVIIFKEKIKVYIQKNDFLQISVLHLLLGTNPRFKNESERGILEHLLSMFFSDLSFPFVIKHTWALFCIFSLWRKIHF